MSMDKAISHMAKFTLLSSRLVQFEKRCFDLSISPYFSHFAIRENLSQNRVTMILLLLLLVSLGCPAQGQNNVLVDTQYGPVRGQNVEVYNGFDTRSVTTFHAIPFAGDTSGQNRFANPVPPTPWTEVFDADTLGDACPQNRGDILLLTHPLWNRFSEDCLHVDVYTPNTEGGPYPVMLWYFGGAFQAGANIQYPGQFLASRDVVVVVANYRVGKFGYSYTGNEACPGNAGLWDQKMALEWVITNIGNFGGNASHITVFGQSAGAASTGHLVVSPHTKDLFQQAILESGTESSFWAVNWPEANPENYTRQVAEQLGCLGETDQESIDCMRLLPWETVHNATFECAPGHFCLGMVPVVDGPGGMLPVRPKELRESGDIMDGPIISGITKDDGSLYTIAYIPESLEGGFNRSEFLYYLEERLLAIWEEVLDEETREDAVRAVDYNYTPWPYIEDEHANRDAFNQMVTDAAFGAAWDYQIKHHHTLAPTYAYVYNYRGRNSSRLFPEWMGVPHMGELPYVWGYPLLQLNQAVRNDSRIVFDVIKWTEEDIAHTVFWQELYVNFAKFGNPTPTPVVDPLGEPITWPQFTWEEMNVIYVSNTTVHTEKEWEQKDYAFWVEYMAYITEGTDVPIPDRHSDGKQGMDSNYMTGVIGDYLADTVFEQMLDIDVIEFE